MSCPGPTRPGVARAPGRGDAEAVGTSVGYWTGPLTIFLVLGVVVLLMRWTFSRGHSLVQRPPRAGSEGEYGLLVAIASPATYVEGEMLRRRLEDAGVRATLTQTADGPRVMVFPADERTARRLLAQ